MIDSQDYTDWCNYAGLYLKNYSKADRYQTYEQKISEVGLVTRIVHDFLHDMGDDYDLQWWRSYAINETGNELKYRIHKTIFALNAIGAIRIAEKIPTIKNRSFSGMIMESQSENKDFQELMQSFDPAQLRRDIQKSIANEIPEIAKQAGIPVNQSSDQTFDPEIETAAEIRLLLDAYVTSHQEELQADLDRLGDPRLNPEFDPEAHLAELQEQHFREERAKTQQRDLQLLQEYIKEFEQKAAAEPGKTFRFPDKLTDLCQKYEKYKHEMHPKLKTGLERIDAFRRKPGDKSQPQVTSVKTVQKRLKKIGPYTVEEERDLVLLIWPEQDTLQTDWTSLSIEIEFPPGQNKALRLLLNALDRLQTRFSSLAADLQQQIVDTFGDYWSQMDDHEKSEFDVEFDSEGIPDFDSLKPYIGTPSITLDIPEWPVDDAVAINGFLGVEWDHEHGLMFEWADLPEANVAAPATTMPPHVQFTQAGPQLTPADIQKFETEHQIQLPQLYRDFLMQTNGGIPVPNHLQLKSGGVTTPLDFHYFFGINANNPEQDLKTALKAHTHFPVPGYLPIAKFAAPDQLQGRSDFFLYLCITGNKQNQIVHALITEAELAPEALAKSVLAGFTPDELALNFQHGSELIAFDIFSLIKALSEQPVKKLPAWLQALRNQDHKKFIKWIEKKGKLHERYNEYGYWRNWTVLTFIAQEADPELIQQLLEKNLLVREKLLENWFPTLDPNLKRFQELMTVLEPEYWRYVFKSSHIWDNPELLEQIARQKPDFDAGIDSNGKTPLIQTVLYGSPQGVRWLLDHGASPLKSDKLNNTPLSWAVHNEQLDCLIKLLDAGVPLEMLVPGKSDMDEKLSFLKKRWRQRFPELLAYLKQRGVDTSGVE
ncbi:ankyrin repeat domain-containing protein [Gimesia sp.]|uniref:ankyrin repeat domain-containing protein n=1 Tax=Gimesia sp. TaxID=2024833 RepID=UPI003A90288E